MPRFMLGYEVVVGLSSSRQAARVLNVDEERMRSMKAATSLDQDYPHDKDL